MKRLRILLADDHPLIRAGLKALIAGQPDLDVAGEADNGREVPQQVQTLQPDLVVMDIAMPGADGVQATEQVKRLCPGVKVLALSIHKDAATLRQMLNAGASGYLLKRSADEEILRAIRVVAGGGVYLDPALTHTVVAAYLGSSVGRAYPQADLSERETEVLRLTAWGYTNKEIADRLGISVKTVETHKARFMQKLDLQSRVDIVRYALRQGWMKEE
jgi:DNA-binding NarL/FixJ family response regulator